MVDDPLEPTLASFQYSVDELAAIELALKLKNPWDETQDELKTVKGVLISIKKRIRDFHLLRQKNQCCYCRLNLTGGGSFMVDREHIVPKSKFPRLTYEISNLSVACKRCNMEYKKNGVTFLASLNNAESAHADKAQYKFIHPNFESYSSFITRHQRQEGDNIFVHFAFDRTCAKSDFTYKYFDLRGLEVNSYNAAQGISLRLSDEIKLLELQRLTQEKDEKIKLLEVRRVIQEKDELINQLLKKIGRDEYPLTGIDFEDIKKERLPKLPGLPGGSVLALPSPGKTSS